MKTDFGKNTRNFFSRPTYFKKGKNQAVELSEFSPARRFEFETFLEFLRPQPGAKLIELGSGYGRFVLPLLNLGYRVTAVDISAPGLASLENEAKKNQLEKRLKTVLSDLRQPVLVDEFDAAFCISTFHLLAEKEGERITILSNLVKNIKPGGKVLLIEPNPLNPFYYPYYWFSSEVSWEVEKHFIKSTEGNLKKILENLGLGEIQVKYVGFLPLRLMEIFPGVKSFNKLFNRIPLLNKFSSFIYIKAKMAS